MLHTLLLALVLLACHGAAFWAWAYFTQREAGLNLADITADGSADSLRAGYHSRRTWARFWPWLGLSVGASLPGLLTNYWVFQLSFLALGVLLAAYFARFFTPALNLARGLSEFYASSDSANWPDAAIYKRLRADYPDWAADSQQGIAYTRLESLLGRVWLWGLITYAAGLIATALLFLH